MPRDSNGTYTLPSGNPVVTGTVIAAGWANPTMGDIGNELTNSLDRQGRGGMLAPFKFLDGTAGAPGMTWTSEPTMGFFRAGASEMAATVAGIPRMRWTGVGVDVWDSLAATWLPLTTAAGSNFALLNAENSFTVGQKIIAAAGSWNVHNAVVPTSGARLSNGIWAANQIGVDLYNGTSWFPILLASPTQTRFRGEAIALDSLGGTEYASFGATGATIRKSIATTSVPNALQTYTWTGDDNGNCYWNTNAGAIGYQWYLNSILTMALSGTPSTGGLLLFGKGSALYHNDASYAYGGVFVSTSAAPASGGTPGQVWLQVDV